MIDVLSNIALLYCRASAMHNVRHKYKRRVRLKYPAGCMIPSLATISCRSAGPLKAHLWRRNSTELNSGLKMRRYKRAFKT